MRTQTGCELCGGRSDAIHTTWVCCLCGRWVCTGCLAVDLPPGVLVCEQCAAGVTAPPENRRGWDRLADDIEVTRGERTGAA